MDELTQYVTEQVADFANTMEQQRVHFRDAEQLGDEFRLYMSRTLYVGTWAGLVAMTGDGLGTMRQSFITKALHVVDWTAIGEHYADGLVTGTSNF